MMRQAAASFFYGTICQMSKKERHYPTNAVVLRSQGALADTGAQALRSG